ncbi:hypothetical protein N431DRAFT_500477 [Stipitochalara longipes BDJ]|nr:hypothetical protein N431DRAFT_500477 [Stipitochalara longipes BDJ]
MGHDQEDDPGSSGLIKQEPADEGIYASTRERTFSEIFSWHNKTDARGLTLQPVRQSLDPQPTHVVRSLTDEEKRRLDIIPGFHGESLEPRQGDDPSSFVPQNDMSNTHSVSPYQGMPLATEAQMEISGSQTTSVSLSFISTTTAKLAQQLVQFDPFRSVSPPPSQPTDSASLPAQGEQLILQLRSVSTPRFRKTRTKALQQPLQSNNIALASPTSKERLSGQSAPQPDQQEQRISRTPSVSTPHPCETNIPKALRQPQQSDCFGSNSQTPGRSETPPTPIDFEDAFPDDFALPDEIFGTPNFDINFGQEEATPRADHYQQHPFATNFIFRGSQELASPLQPMGIHSSQAHPVIDLTEESNTSTFTSLRTGPYEPFPGAPTVWNPNTPIQSIECHQRSHQPPPTTLINPRGYRPSAKPNIYSELSFQEQLSNYLAGRSESLAKGESCEKRPQHKRNQSANSNSPPTRLDPSTTHKFATFMKLRNSLPISALIAMMAPPNQTQVLATLAELSNMQTPSSTHSATHELPAAMRAMLDNLMQKLNSDKAFLKSVITYASEQLMKNDQDKEESVIPKSVLETGLDKLTTLPQAREQLLKERSHFHEILSNQEYMVNHYRKQNGKLMATLNSNNSTSKSSAEPQPELNGDGSIKHNPFWVCGHVTFDGSGAKCNGINQEWHRHHCQRRSLPTRWTLRQICAKCSRPNNANRRYLTDDEARMFTTFVTQQQAPATMPAQAQLFGMSPQEQHFVLFQQPMAQSVAMFPQPMTPHPMPAMSPMAQQPVVQHLMIPSSLAKPPNAPPPTIQSALAMPAMAQQPAVHSTPTIPPLTQSPMIQSNLAMLQIIPPLTYSSPYAATPEPSKKRKASEPAASPSPKRSHPGFNIPPAVHDTLRRELPLKEWMKPKDVVREGPGTSGEPITIDEEATIEEPGTSEDDMASLFGDDEKENENEEGEDEFDAMLNEALDEALASM